MGVKEVAAGTSWLDENFPGWEREIDLGTLNINDCQNCICGQSLSKFVDDVLFSGYDVAMAFVVDSPSDNDIYRNREEGAGWAYAHGFCPSYKDGPQGSELEQIWRELIKERFNTGNLSDI